MDQQTVGLIVAVMGFIGTALKLYQEMGKTSDARGQAAKHEDAAYGMSAAIKNVAQHLPAGPAQQLVQELGQLEAHPAITAILKPDQPDQPAA